MELTRVIELRNASGYKVQTGTEDGFAPVATSAVVPASALSASCSATYDGKSGLTWNSSVSGGTGPYSYSWSMYNDVSSYGSGSTVSKEVSVIYSNSGTKQAYLMVKDSVGKSVGATCSGTVQNSTISPVVPPTNVYCTAVWAPVCGSNGVTYSNSCYANQAGITSYTEGSCSSIPTPSPTPIASPLSVSNCQANSDIDKGITWFAQASGGTSPYTYSWNMYNDVANYVSGSTASAKVGVTYSTIGTKQAVVNVKDSAGKTAQSSCSGTVYQFTTNTVAPVTPTYTSPIYAYCFATKDTSSQVYKANWTAGVSGGTAPYRYSWSIYGSDVSFTSGSASSKDVGITYGTAGLKQAVLNVTDASGKSSSASCSTTIIANPTSSTAPSTSGGTTQTTTTNTNNTVFTTQACGGTVPSGTGVVKGYGYYNTGYTPNVWTYTSGYVTSACQWTCASGSTVSGNTCVSTSPQNLSNGIRYSIVPGMVVAGQQFNVQVVNTGTKTWGASHDVALSNSNLTTNYQMVNIGNTPPNTPKNIVFTAPSVPGTYVLRAVEQNVEWFGTNQTITVVNSTSNNSRGSSSASVFEAILNLFNSQ